MERDQLLKIPIVSHTVTIKASPTQTLMAVPIETNEVTPLEKAAGFEVVLAIAILITAYKIGKKRR